MAATRGPGRLLEHQSSLPQTMGTWAKTVNSREIHRVESTGLGDGFSMEVGAREVERVTPEWLIPVPDGYCSPLLRGAVVQWPVRGGH